MLFDYPQHFILDISGNNNYHNDKLIRTIMKKPNTPETSHNDSEASPKRGELSESSNAPLNSPNSLEPLRVPEPNLDIRALHGPLGTIVDTIQPDTEAHPAAILIQAMTGLGNIIGRGPYCQIQENRHYANLFTIVVGASSVARKGTAWGIAKTLLNQIAPSWVSSNIKNGLQSGEAIVGHLQDFPISDTSLLLDKRLCLVEDEFSQVLQAGKRNGSKVSSIMRLGWDHGNLHLLTKKNPLTATGCHISVIGHITRKELRKLLSSNDTSNGFANRFLWIFSKRTKLLSQAPSLDLNSITKELQMLENAVFKASRMGEVEIKRSARADLLWNDLYKELNDIPEGLWGDTTSRGPAQVMRLALLYCLLDGEKTIEPHHLLAAKALWNYSRDSARWVFEEYTVSDPALRILKALEDGKTLSGADIHRINHNKLSAEEKNAALEEIKDEIDLEVRKTRGRDKVTVRRKAA
ncbi:MAG: hypothetical protein ORN23_01835 [Chthoniobacterales bacterium]|nr:hypothetical protein [Chthoniobacterales bacterium]